MTRPRTPTTLAPRPGELALVAAGGAVGAVLRAAAAQVTGGGGDGWPWSSLLVNVVGCFGLAVLFVLVTAPSGASRGVRLLLGTGVLGGFTTFSTVMHDAASLGREAEALAYLAVSVASMVAAAVLGWLVTAWLTGRAAPA